MMPAPFRVLGNRKIVLAVVGIVAVSTLVIQKYVMSTLHPEILNSKHSIQLQELYGTGKIDSAMLFKSRPGPASAGAQTHSKTKSILWHSFPYYYELKAGKEAYASCNHSCTSVLDANKVKEVDLVVFYSHHHKSPPSGVPGQLWAFFCVESPIYSDTGFFDNPVWHNYFNWTMTYRRDSDIYFGYGDFTRSPASQPRDFSSLVAGKSKLMAWFVSHCSTQSKREDYVKALKEFAQVDVYGQCGDLKCGKDQPQSCMKMLSKDYFFYLALENSICKDYLTEKLYSIMKNVDVVPVVMGGANYSALLPKNSFIDVSQFPSVKALADFLKLLAGDTKRYKSYFAWKNEWKVIEPMPLPLCELCHRAHEPQKWAHIHPNVQSWWNKCSAPPSVIKS